MAIRRSRIDRRAIMRIGAHQAVSHLVHLRLSNKPRSGAQKTVDDSGVGARRRMGRRPLRVAIGRDVAGDVDIFLDDEGRPGERAFAIRAFVQDYRDRAHIDCHHGNLFSSAARVGRRLRRSSKKARRPAEHI
jgi:hypothetical protein